MNWSAAVIILLGSASCSFSAAIRGPYRHYGINTGRLHHSLMNQRYNIHRAKLIYGSTIKNTVSNQQEVSSVKISKKPISPIESTVQEASATKTVEIKEPSVQKANDKIILISTETQPVEQVTTEPIPMLTSAPQEVVVVKEKAIEAPEQDVFELDRSLINLRALVSVEEAREETESEGVDDSISPAVVTNEEDLDSNADNFENIIPNEITEPPFIDPSIPFVQSAAGANSVAPLDIPVNLSFLRPVPAVPGLPVRSQPDVGGFLLVDDLPEQVNMQIREVVLKPVPAVPGRPVLNP